MNTVEIKDYVLVKVPEGSTDYLYMPDGRLQVDWIDGKMWNTDTILGLPKGNYQIIGLAKDLKKQEIEKIVESITVKMPLVVLTEWKDYLGGENWATAISSFHSLLKHHKLEESNTLILKKI